MLFSWDCLVHNLSSHVCGLPCVICGTAVLEGKYCFSFLQLRRFARLITFSKDHVTGKKDKLNSSQGPPIYSEPLSIKHLNHFPSWVPKVRGPFRTTASSLEIRRNILKPWRIYLSQKPQKKIEHHHSTSWTKTQIRQRQEQWIDKIKSILSEQRGGGGGRKKRNAHEGFSEGSPAERTVFSSPEQVRLLSADPDHMHNNGVAFQVFSHKQSCHRSMATFERKEESPYLEVIHV